MAARTLKGEKHAKGFFPRGLFTVSIDRLSERGTTRNLLNWYILKISVSDVAHFKKKLSHS